MSGPRPASNHRQPKPTDEQRDFIDGACRGEDMIAQAGAGTGKSSTVRGACTAMSNKKILYVVFGKAAQLEAEHSFPKNTECRTIHSLAYQDVGWKYRDRAYSKSHVKKDVNLLGQDKTKFYLDDPVVDEGHEKFVVSGYTLVSLARRTIDRFCASPGEEIELTHVPLYRDWKFWSTMRMIHSLGEDVVSRLSKVDRERLKEQYWTEFYKFQKIIAAKVLPLAKVLWERTQSPDSEHYFTADMFLKLWAMKKPKLPFDSIIVDEAQDSTKLIRSIILNQDSQKIAVGDSFQQMYKWRGAVDILEDWPGKQYQLSQSFRFGEEIAEQGARWIKMAGGDFPLRGTKTLESRALVGPKGNPDAILCRSNAVCIAQALAELEAGRSVGIAGGVQALMALVYESLKLIRGERSDHPDLMDFTSWMELVAYAKTPDGQEYRVLVKLLNTYGNNLVNILNKIVKENKADVVVSTYHKAKGLEWNDVFIAPPYELEEGMEIPVPENEISSEEAMANYVAVTRARRTLNYLGVSWIDRHPAFA